MFTLGKYVDWMCVCGCVCVFHFYVLIYLHLFFVFYKKVLYKKYYIKLLSLRETAILIYLRKEGENSLIITFFMEIFF